MITDRPFYVIFMAPWTKYRWFTWATPYPTEAEAINAIQQLQSIDSYIPKLQARIDLLEAEKDKLEAENASLNTRLDILTDMLARARECRR